MKRAREACHHSPICPIIKLYETKRYAHKTRPWFTRTIWLLSLPVPLYPHSDRTEDSIALMRHNNHIQSWYHLYLFLISCLFTVTFVPTVPHCSLASLIGLCIREKLKRTLPYRTKINIFVKEGTHASEADGEVYYYSISKGRAVYDIHTGNIRVRLWFEQFGDLIAGLENFLNADEFLGAKNCDCTSM